MAGPTLLAHVLVSKFDDHLPLYRQHEIFDRMGTHVARILVDPLNDVLASDLLHADDTPIRVLDRSMRDKGLG